MGLNDLEKDINYVKKKPWRGIGYLFLAVVIFLIAAAVSSYISEIVKINTESAKFKSHISNLLVENRGERPPTLFLVLTISNLGSKQITPTKFKLFIKDRWKWISLKEMIIVDYPSNY